MTGGAADQADRYRLVVLGSSRVGKTSLIKRYLYKSFPDKYKETVEDVYPRDFHIGGSRLPLNVYDTNFNYPDMRRVSISAANAFLFVFAVNDVNSFKEIYTATVNAWLAHFTGRKNVAYLECSAKNDDNVVAIFKSLLDQSGFVQELLQNRPLPMDEFNTYDDNETLPGGHHNKKHPAGGTDAKSSPDAPRRAMSWRSKDSSRCLVDSSSSNSRSNDFVRDDKDF